MCGEFSFHFHLSIITQISHETKLELDLHIIKFSKKSHRTKKIVHGMKQVITISLKSIILI
jgi:hypothetical protein